MAELSDEQRNRLERLLHVQSVTGRTERMIAHMQQELLDAGMTVTKRDGQLFARKGDFSKPVPFYIAHADTVHDIIHQDRLVVERSFNKKLKDHEWWAWDNITHRAHGVGGDDKCGLFVCIEAARSLENVGVIITIDEEAGCIGAYQVQADDLSDAAVLIQADRRHDTDAITYAAGTRLSSAEWQAHVSPIIIEHGYRWSTGGTITDVQAFVSSGAASVSAINLAAGYYQPHTDDEFISETDLLRATNIALALGRASAGQAWAHRDKRTYSPRARRASRARRSLYEYEDTGNDTHDAIVNALYEKHGYYGRHQRIPGGITITTGDGTTNVYHTIAEWEEAQRENSGLDRGASYCDSCQDYGHTWWDCPDMNPYDLFCVYCQERGHDDDSCPYQSDRFDDNPLYAHADAIAEEDAEWEALLARADEAALVNVAKLTKERVLGVPESKGDWVAQDAFPASVAPARSKQEAVKAEPKESKPQEPQPKLREKHLSMLKRGERKTNNLTVAELIERAKGGEKASHTCQAVGCEEPYDDHQPRLELDLCQTHLVIANTLFWLYGDHAIPRDVETALEQRDIEEARALAQQDIPQSSHPIEHEALILPHDC